MMLRLRRKRTLQDNHPRDQHRCNQVCVGEQREAKFVRQNSVRTVAACAVRVVAIDARAHSWTQSVEAAVIASLLRHSTYDSYAAKGHH